MIRKGVSLWLIILLILGLFVVIDFSNDITTSVEAKTIYVDDDYEFENATHKKTIQAAVDNATPGDTVFIYAGNYYGSVIVNKTLNLSGEDRNTTIIDGSGSDDVIYINTNWVNIICLTITNGSNGIFLKKSNNITLMDNDISNNDNGIYIEENYNFHEYDKVGRVDVYIINNNIFLNNESGIYIEPSRNIIIMGNNISNNSKGINFQSIGISSGIGNNYTRYIISSTNVTITNNIIHNYYRNINARGLRNAIITQNIISKGQIGIILYDSDNITISDNSIFNTSYGLDIRSTNNVIITNNIAHTNQNAISISSSQNITLTHNNVLNNQQYGIFLDSCNNSFVKNNNASNNGYGIYIFQSSENNIISNLFFMNNQMGIFLHWSNWNNIIANIISNNVYGVSIKFANNNTLHHNNFINNMNQINISFPTESENFWYDGVNEGNYWSDYDGIDENEDYVGDTGLPHRNVDYHPLINPVDITLDYETIVDSDDDNYEKNEGLIYPYLQYFGILIFFIGIIILLVLIRRSNKIKKIP